MINKYPYTDFHELNADWLLKNQKDLDSRVARHDTDIKTVNDRIDDLKEDLKDTNDSIGNVATRVDNLSGRVEINTAYIQQNKLDIDGNREDIDKNTEEIADLTTAISKLEPLVFQNAGSHNSIYRGKNLGSQVTDKQYAEIAAGTFNDLYLGDYWIFNDKKYVIVGFNYLDSSENHVAIVSDSLYTSQFNPSGTETGYLNSLIKISNLSTALDIVKNNFGESHILTHKIYANTTNAGTFGYQDTQVDLLSAYQISSKFYSSTLYSNNIIELPICHFDVKLFESNYNYWLREAFGQTITQANFYRASYKSISSQYVNITDNVRVIFGIK